VSSCYIQYAKKWYMMCVRVAQHDVSMISTERVAVWNGARVARIDRLSGDRIPFSTQDFDSEQAFRAAFPLQPDLTCFKIDIEFLVTHPCT
jgi:hypothetical protein